jgi:hypothetical protein
VAALLLSDDQEFAILIKNLDRSLSQVQLSDYGVEAGQ